MASDVNKNLDRAKKFLERNRIEDAIEAYLSVLDEAPSHAEATQALGDLYSRMDNPERAAFYYGAFFDLLVEARDEIKAVAIYSRFLRASKVQQPPERMARYAFLLQKQNRPEEAVEVFNRAGEMFTSEGRLEDALFCWERTAQINPEDVAGQLRLGEAAERAGKPALAAHAFLRAAQLASASHAEADALQLLGRAHELAPADRGVSLLFAEAKLRAGAPSEAAALLEPFSASENDELFLETFAEALARAGQLDRARGILERLLKEKNAGALRLFDLADRYVAAKEGAKAVEILHTLKRKMFADSRQNEFAVQTDALAERHLDSGAILEFWASLYNELNRESKYYEILLRLFDLYLSSSQVDKARETLEYLVDVDAYDYRNQERLERLRGLVEDSQFKSLAGRLMRSAQHQTSESGHGSSAPPPPQSLADGGRSPQALEDLIVQTEIFLQYSLQNKAIERLQKIAEMFPGEEEHNTRLRNLCELANWWPPGATKPKPADAALPVAEVQPVGATSKTGTYSAETLRDLAKISEITQKIYRQQTPRAMLNTAVIEAGMHLGVTRALAMIGAPGRSPEMMGEYCVAGTKPAPAAQVVFLIAETEKAAPDSLGGLVVDASKSTLLKEMGLSTALGVLLTDKATQARAGMLIVAHAGPHTWKPNDTFFLQAVGDQMLMSVSHTRLRSLVRRMGVSEERSGLLSRSSYQSCLLTEVDRIRVQGTPLSLMILQIDRGAEILRQQGETALDRYLEQIAMSLQPIVRQNDVAVKYTSWSLAFILPDTTLAGAHNLTEKLRRAAAAVPAPGDGMPLSMSAAIVEAAGRPDYDNEDIVTDLINRAEACLDEARKRGGDSVVALEIPIS